MIEQLKTEQAVLQHINETCESSSQIEKNINEMLKINNQIVNYRAGLMLERDDLSASIEDLQDTYDQLQDRPEAQDIMTHIMELNNRIKVITKELDFN